MAFVGDFVRSLLNLVRNGPVAAPAPAAGLVGVPPLIAAIPVPAVVPAAAPAAPAAPVVAPVGGQNGGVAANDPGNAAPNPGALQGGAAGVGAAAVAGPVQAVNQPIILGPVALWLTNHGPPAGVHNPLDGLRLQVAMQRKAAFEQDSAARYLAALPRANNAPLRAAAACRKAVGRAIARGRTLLRPVVNLDDDNYLGLPFVKVSRSRVTARTHGHDVFARFAGVEFETQNMFKYWLATYVVYRLGQGMTVLESKALADGALKGYVCARYGVSSADINRQVVI